MHSAQTVALNSIVIEMARCAAVNVGQDLPAAETYMRLAPKAQSQCCTTVETLAEMKNPRAVAHEAGEHRQRVTAYRLPARTRP
jgi:hypothetical protein